MDERCRYQDCPTPATHVLWPQGQGTVALVPNKVPKPAAWRRRWGWNTPSHCQQHATALAAETRETARASLEAAVRRGDVTQEWADRAMRGLAEPPALADPLA